MHPNFGDILRTIRRDRGLDLKELEQTSGVAISLISRLENNLSQPTVTSAVSLAYALHVPLSELASAMGIKGLLTRYNDGKFQFQPNVLNIQDIESFLVFYNTEFTHAKELMRHFYGRVIRTQNPQLNEFDAFLEAADKIAEATRPIGNRYVPLPYPTELDPSYLEQTLVHQGILIFPDVGYYIRKERIKSNKTMMDVAEQAGVSHSAISRLERGAIERINLNEIIAIDNILGLEGEVLSMCWSAGQFHTGVIRNIAQDLEVEPPLAWPEEYYALAEAVIKLERWYTSLNIPFLGEFRASIS